jgi:hypothetical protein
MRNPREKRPLYIGFTGTREGMTEKQKGGLDTILRTLCLWSGGVVFHHGGEPHSDREAALIAKSYGARVIPHPPDYDTAEAKLARNIVIVLRGRDLLIAAPRTMKEEVRSGTWYTVRQARKIDRAVALLDP